MKLNTGSVIALRLAGLICLVAACGERQVAEHSYVVELEAIAKLMDSPGEIEFSSRWPSTNILRDSRGRFYAHPIGGHRIAVFDSMGVYLYSFGREGHGPGELGRSPLAVLCDADERIWVWEFRSRKVTIYDTEGEFVETVQWPVRPPIRPDFQLKDGSLLGIASAQLIRGYSGYSLHRTTVTGELLSSFGNVIPGDNWEQVDLYQMVGALTRDGLLWMTPVGRYRLELWDPLTEEQLRTLPIDVPWFKETIGPQGDWMAVEPTDAIIDLSVDESGVIWILIQTAADDWRPARNPEEYDEAPMPQEERSKYFGWMVQAIHPETGKVMAERRFPDEVWMLLGSTGLVTAKLNEETGIASFSIWRPVLVKSADIVDN